MSSTITALGLYGGPQPARLNQQLAVADVEPVSAQWVTASVSAYARRYFITFTDALAVNVVPTDPVLIGTSPILPSHTVRILSPHVQSH